TYTFDAYGNLLDANGTTENDYLYRGEQDDAYADLQYLRARYYDTDTGRFISTDPFEGWQEVPISRHRYVYGNDNPVMNVDPSGLVTLADISARFTFESVLNSLTLVGLAFAPAQFIGSQLAGIDHDGIHWKGYQLSFDASFGQTSRLLLATGLGADIYYVNLVSGANDQYREVSSLTLAIHANYGWNSPQTPQFTVGTFEVWTPRSFGYSISALGGGYMAFGGSIFAGDPELGLGYAKQALLMGYGRGNADGFGVARGRGIAIEAQLGLSIPLYLGEHQT
ncbi:MAG: RHS repeat-associated core domain-containing protein, partial [Cyanothece sp. SIO2G6]|nr:RHS repeat-associated core domain-containing protein [Cyanothece sp. SIO2G6]